MKSAQQWCDRAMPFEALDDKPSRYQMEAEIRRSSNAGEVAADTASTWTINPVLPTSRLRLNL